MTDQLTLIEVLGFTPKENVADVYLKQYSNLRNYVIEVDFHNKVINYGSKIKGESKTTQNFFNEENWVVLECIDRLLTKGYRPEDITLEKVFPSGHGHSGRLDIFIQKEGRAFLMIECKTAGKEYGKELKNILKNGGQLFTYFQNDTNTQYLMLYSSQLKNGKIESNWDIVKVEDHYRGAGNVADFYDRWSKVTYQNGIFEDWVSPYDFKNKLLTKKELLPLKETDSEAIFHGFMSILRKHSVSDEPNAFNKIFNLFLAKIFDEKKRDGDELEFQWKEKIDDPVEFQVRLINLYQKGMYEFLRKEVEGISDDDFTYKTIEELHEKKKKWLMFNNVFAIKEVIDSESFDDNHRVLKEVVELLHKYQIRYPRRQAHLSDFFERLLTTGLKQKAGQYFSPPPVTRFITKSLPLKDLINDELNGETAKLPAVIDYAVGSGHFITEIMEEYQNIIDNDIDETNLYPDVKETVEVWQKKKYDWASKYIFGVEKDYRLVKVAKVGCYFYGDGLAQIIHGDGLDSFKDSKSYVGRLKKVNESELEKFSVVVSNPPYSVPAFKGDLKNKKANEDFELFNLLTDKSSEIECLFIERTKQLLKDGGIAAIILPSSILTNTGNLHTKARDLILLNFDIIAIAEFGGNTFMATDTNTVTLFLRRRYKKVDDLKKSCRESLTQCKNVTINGVEKSISKYVEHVWDNTLITDYFSLLQRTPNETILSHDIYKDYRKKIKAKDEDDFWNVLLSREEEKFFSFILTYHQRVVIVKAGEKDVEKDFLGYEFSNRRGNEGMFPRLKGQTIDECTSMYSLDKEDSSKANHYILNAFKGIYDLDIDEKMSNHVRYVGLVDMLTLDRAEFDKNLSLRATSQVIIDSSWKQTKLEELAVLIKRGKSAKYGNSSTQIIKSGQARGHREFDFTERHFVEEGFVLDERKLEKGDILINSTGVGTAGRVNLFDLDGDFVVDSHITIVRPNIEKVYPEYIMACLSAIGFKNLEAMALGQSGQIELSIQTIQNIKIPLPSRDLQKKLIQELTEFDDAERSAFKQLQSLKTKCHSLVNALENPRPLNDYFLVNASTFNPTDKWPSEYFTYIDIDSVGKGDGKIDYTKKLLGKNAPSRARRVALDNSVVISTVRPYLKGFAFIEKVPEKTIFSTGFSLLNSKDESQYLPKLLYYQFMLSDDLTRQMNAAMPKAAYPSINKEDIENFLIFTPEPADQSKILKDLDKLQNEIEIAEQTLMNIPHRKTSVLLKYLN